MNRRIPRCPKRSRVGRSPFSSWGQSRADDTSLHVASAYLGPAPFGAPAPGSATGLDREPGPSRALAPAARASSPLGDFARRERMSLGGETRALPLTLLGDWQQYINC